MHVCIFVYVFACLQVFYLFVLRIYVCDAALYLTLRFDLPICLAISTRKKPTLKLWTSVLYWMTSDKVVYTDPSTLEAVAGIQRGKVLTTVGRSVCILIELIELFSSF